MNFQDKLNIMRENTEDQFKRLEYILNEDNDLGKLSRYLLTTERNPYNIFNEGYSQENISDFLCLVYELNHSLYDDGDITFYSVNGAPRISLKYDFDDDDYLSDFEKTLLEKYKDSQNQFPDTEDYNLYECNILDIDIDSWIILSEEYHKEDIKQCFLSDYDGEQSAIAHYKKYKCFDESWIAEAKNDFK